MIQTILLFTLRPGVSDEQIEAQRCLVGSAYTTWMADSRPGAGQVPVYLAGRCLKVRLPADEPASSPRCAAGTAG